MKLEQLPTQTYIPLHYTRLAFLLWICCTTFETFSKSSSPVIHAFHHLLHNWLMPRDTHWFHHQLNQSAIQFSSVQLLSYVRLFATPWTITHQALLSMGFPRQEYWNGLSCPPPGDLSDLGIEFTSPALTGGFFTTEPPGKPYSKATIKLYPKSHRTHLLLLIS